MRTTEPRSEPEVDANVDLAHATDRGGLAEERRGQRAAVPEIVRFVRQILRLDEELQTIAGGPEVDAPHLCRRPRAEYADTGRLRRRRVAERKIVAGEHVHRHLPARSQCVAADAKGTIVENAVAVVVLAGE